MGRPTVSDQSEIARNVAHFWGLDTGKGTVKPNTKALKMLAAAHNLVAVEFEKVGVLFAPSRFTGYACNTFPAHDRDRSKNGGVTDPALTRIVGVEPTPNAALEKTYRTLCDRHGAKPHKRVRDYWPPFHAGNVLGDGDRRDSPTDRPRRKGTKVRPKWTRNIPARDATEADQLHNRLQERLFKLLKGKYGGGHVAMEEDFVDLRVSHPDCDALIEVKSNARPRFAIREALGQLLDYAYAINTATDVPEKLALVVAAPGRADEESQSVLEFIKAKTGLELRYVRITEKTKKCPL